MSRIGGVVLLLLALHVSAQRAPVLATFVPEASLVDSSSNNTGTNPCPGSQPCPAESKKTIEVDMLNTGGDRVVAEADVITPYSHGEDDLEARCRKEWAAKHGVDADSKEAHQHCHLAEHSSESSHHHSSAASSSSSSSSSSKNTALSKLLNRLHAHSESSHTSSSSSSSAGKSSALKDLLNRLHHSESSSHHESASESTGSALKDLLSRLHHHVGPSESSSTNSALKDLWSRLHHHVGPLSSSSSSSSHSESGSALKNLLTRLHHSTESASSHHSSSGSSSALKDLLSRLHKTESKVAKVHESSSALSGLLARLHEHSESSHSASSAHTKSPLEKVLEKLKPQESSGSILHDVSSSSATGSVLRSVQDTLNGLKASASPSAELTIRALEDRVRSLEARLIQEEQKTAHLKAEHSSTAHAESSSPNVAAAILGAVKEANRAAAPVVHSDESKLNELKKESADWTAKLQDARKIASKELKTLGRTREDTKRKIEDATAQLAEIQKQSTKIREHLVADLEAKKQAVVAQATLPESAKLAAKLSLERAEVKALKALVNSAAKVSEESSSLGSHKVMHSYQSVANAHKQLKSSLALAKSELFTKGVVTESSQQAVEHARELLHKVQAQLAHDEHVTHEKLGEYLHRGPTLHSEVSEISESVGSIKNLEKQIYSSQQADSKRIAAALDEIKHLHSEASDVVGALLQEQRGLSQDVFSVKEREDRVEAVLKEVDARVIALEGAMDNYFPEDRKKVSRHQASQFVKDSQHHHHQSAGASSLSHHSQSALEHAAHALSTHAPAHPSLSSHHVSESAHHSHHAESSSHHHSSESVSRHSPDPAVALKNLEGSISRVKTFFNSLLQRRPSAQHKPSF